MADLEQKVHEMEASTFDGVFIWKIPDFARKRQEAVAGRTPAIFSPGVLLELALPLSCCHPGPLHVWAGVCPLLQPGAAGSPGRASSSAHSHQPHVRVTSRSLNGRPTVSVVAPSAPRWT